MHLFKNFPTSGVVEVMEKARQKGYSPSDFSWLNLGQGSPEISEIKGDFPRIQNISKTNQYAGYSPVAGLKSLRQKIADNYNLLFRKDKKSQYSYKNVCITSGGRPALVKILAITQEANFGYLTPDYASYAGSMTVFPHLNYIPIPISREAGFKINVDYIIECIQKFGLKFLLLSNPCNPSGQVILDQDLTKLIEACEAEGCFLIHDEFYSRFIYPNSGLFKNSQASSFKLGQSISAAKQIQDVEQDKVFLIDGLTKSWRYPGFRFGWIIGPSQGIQKISSVSSFLEGGVSHPTQIAVLDLFNLPQQKNKAFLDWFEESTLNIQKTFNQKRTLLLAKLLKLGFKIRSEPLGGFYIFADISGLPAGFTKDMDFVEKLLEHKIITVPGRYFDLNPRNLRSKNNLTSFVRFSYGPPFEVIKKACDKLESIFG